jgi:hypothetical protein
MNIAEICECARETGNKKSAEQVEVQYNNSQHHVVNVAEPPSSQQLRRRNQSGVCIFHTYDARKITCSIRLLHDNIRGRGTCLKVNGVAAQTLLSSNAKIAQ